MELTIKKPDKITVLFDGQSFSVSKPSFGVAGDFKRQMKAAEAGEQDEFIVMTSFLVALGFSEEVVKSMDLESISLVIEALLPKKK